MIAAFTCSSSQDFAAFFGFTPSRLRYSTFAASMLSAVTSPVEESRPSTAVLTTDWNALRSMGASSVLVSSTGVSVTCSSTGASLAFSALVRRAMMLLSLVRRLIVAVLPLSGGLL